MDLERIEDPGLMVNMGVQGNICIVCAEQMRTLSCQEKSHLAGFLEGSCKLFEAYICTGSCLSWGGLGNNRDMYRPAQWPHPNSADPRGLPQPGAAPPLAEPGAAPPLEGKAAVYPQSQTTVHLTGLLPRRWLLSAGATGSCPVFNASLCRPWPCTHSLSRPHGQPASERRPA